MEEAYNSISIQILNKDFLSLQHCMVETMKVGGCNSYRVSHMSNDKLHRQKTLHMLLVHQHCDFVLLEFVKQQLQIE